MLGFDPWDANSPSRSDMRNIRELCWRLCRTQVCCTSGTSARSTSHCSDPASANGDPTERVESFILVDSRTVHSPVRAEQSDACAAHSAAVDHAG